MVEYELGAFYLKSEITPGCQSHTSIQDGTHCLSGEQQEKKKLKELEKEKMVLSLCEHCLHKKTKKINEQAIRTKPTA